MTNPAPMPDLSAPLIHEPSPISGSSDLGALVHLVGTWVNADPTSPMSYNLMVLPQFDPSSPEGYILKNQTYYEEMTFSPLSGTADNRGGFGKQVANPIFYEQRVFFAPTAPVPEEDWNTLIHAENGAWLNLTDQQQTLGPYGHDKFGTPPSQEFSIAKQMSVPHGNSILATGNVTTGTGTPTIPDATGYPTPPAHAPADFLAPYETQSLGNLDPAATKNPNLPIQKALAALSEKQVPTSWIQIDVSTTNAKQPPTNIGFERMHANVVGYDTTIWLESFDAGPAPKFTHLQYSQTIMFELSIVVAGLPTKVLFPHVTSNALVLG